MEHSTQKRVTQAKNPLNLIGPQVRKWRVENGWSQERLAVWLQLRGWNSSRNSVASLELQRRRVTDCELVFIIRSLGIPFGTLFPKDMPLKTIAAQFQPSQRNGPLPRSSKKVKSEG